MLISSSWYSGLAAVLIMAVLIMVVTPGYSAVSSGQHGMVHELRTVSWAGHGSEGQAWLQVAW